MIEQEDYGFCEWEGAAGCDRQDCGGDDSGDEAGASECSGGEERGSVVTAGVGGREGRTWRSVGVCEGGGRGVRGAALQGSVQDVVR